MREPMYVRSLGNNNWNKEKIGDIFYVQPFDDQCGMINGDAFCYNRLVEKEFEIVPNPAEFPIFKFEVGDLVSQVPGGWYFIDPAIFMVNKIKGFNTYDNPSHKWTIKERRTVKDVNWYKSLGNWVSEGGLKKHCSILVEEILQKSEQSTPGKEDIGILDKDGVKIEIGSWVQSEAKYEYYGYREGDGKIAKVIDISRGTFSITNSNGMDISGCSPSYWKVVPAPVLINILDGMSSTNIPSSIHITPSDTEYILSYDLMADGVNLQKPMMIERKKKQFSLQ